MACPWAVGFTFDQCSRCRELYRKLSTAHDVVLVPKGYHYNGVQRKSHSHLGLLVLLLKYIARCGVNGRIQLRSDCRPAHT